MLASDSLRGQKVLITGAAKRLGRELALSLAQAGADIVVHHRASAAEAESLAAEIEEAGSSAWILAGDFEGTEEPERLFGRALDEAGRIDVLINNASLYPEDDFAGLTPDSLAKNINVNALAPFLLSRAFARQGTAGSIINLLDARIGDYDAKHVSYHLSKRMLFSMTRMLALELAPEIRVNGVAPGLILAPDGKDESHLKELAPSNPLNTYGGAQDVVEAVRFLLRSRFITGQILYVDGGRHMLGGVYG